MRVRQPVTALVVVAGLFVAACDGDPGEGAREPDPAEEQARIDQEAVEAAQLRAADLDGEWEERPATEAEIPESQRRIADCLGEDPEVLYPTDEPQSKSPTFTSPEDQEVSSEVDVAPTLDAASARFDALTSRRAGDCIGAELQRYLEEDDPFQGQPVAVGDVTIDRLPVDDVGEESTAFRVSVPLAAGGNEVAVHLDYVLARAGRALISVRASSLFEPFPADELQQLAGRVVDRIDDDALSEALGG